MSPKCKLLLLIIALFIELFLLMRPSLYPQKTPSSTDTDTDTNPLATLKRIITFYERLETLDDEIREIMGTNDYLMGKEGDMTRFSELLAQRPELRLFRTQYILKGERMDKIKKLNKKFLKNALPYLLLEMDAKYDRISNLGKKLLNVAIKWEKKYTHFHDSKKELRKKLEILAASIRQKNNTSSSGKKDEL